MSLIPQERFEVKTELPDTSYVGLDPLGVDPKPLMCRRDEWALHSITFYAYLDFNQQGACNRWAMHICERQPDYPWGTRTIHVNPKFTNDGRVKGVTVVRGINDSPVYPSNTTKRVTVYGGIRTPPDENQVAYLYHREFYEMLGSFSKRITYLGNLLPFDTRQFYLNIVQMIATAGFLSHKTVRDLERTVNRTWLADTIPCDDLPVDYQTL